MSELGSDNSVECPECSTGYLIIREGSNGEFLGCSNFPDCRHTENFDDAAGYGDFNYTFRNK